MILKVLGYLVVASLIPCVYLMVKKHFALREAEQCAGFVTGHEARRGSKGGNVYALKIEYKDAAGVVHKFSTSSASNPPARKIGTEVVVFHHATGRPDVMVFEHLFLGYWLWLSIGLTVLGCFVLPPILQMIYVKETGPYGW